MTRRKLGSGYRLRNDERGCILELHARKDTAILIDEADELLSPWGMKCEDFGLGTLSTVYIENSLPLEVTWVPVNAVITALELHLR